jgi:hypothetical protein
MNERLTQSISGWAWNYDRGGQINMVAPRLPLRPYDPEKNTLSTGHGSLALPARRRSNLLVIGEGDDLRAVCKCVKA